MTHSPGKPLPPGPAVLPGDEFEPPAGRGRQRINADIPVASWLAVLPGLTPHRLRHGHQTWMDEVGPAIRPDGPRGARHEILQIAKPGRRRNGPPTEPHPEKTGTNGWRFFSAEDGQLVERHRLR